MGQPIWLFNGPSNFWKWPIATEIRVPWNVGDQGRSGVVVLNMSFAARDPQRNVLEMPIDFYMAKSSTQLS